MRLIIDIPQGMIDAFSHEGQWTAVLCRDMNTVLQSGIPYEERPKGEWIPRRVITKDRSFDMVVCSNCQTKFSWDAETGVSMDNYMTCPNCTADMREADT